MEQSNSKKYIIITVVSILIIGVIFIALYFYLRPNQAQTVLQNNIVGQFFGFPQTKTVPPETTNKQLPPPVIPPPETSIGTTTEPVLLQLTDFPVVAPTLNNKEDRILFFKKEGGNLLSYNLAGTIKDTLSGITVIGILNASWSPQKDRSVVSYLDQEIIKSFLLIGTSSIALLPQNITSPSWSPDGKNFSYLSLNNNKINLVIADLKGKNQKVIFTTPLREVSLAWVTNDLLSITTLPSGFAEGFSFLYSSARGTFDKTISGFGLMTQWSPSGKYLLTSTTNDRGKKLEFTIQDNTGTKIFDTNFTTLPEKCVWVGVDEALCAVFKNLPASVIFPDEYIRGQFHPSDTIVDINIKIKEVHSIFSDGDFDIQSISMTKDKKYLIFVNNKDGTLWRYKMK